MEAQVLYEDERYERVYQRRKTRFQQLQQTQDVSKERLFILSDGKPWEVFSNGYTDGRLHRRKLVFERIDIFPPLHEACISGDKDLVRCLLNTSGVCVLERDTCGRIALHHAVINEKVKIIKRLLRRRDAKLQAHVRDNSSRTALHYTLEKMELLARHQRGRSTAERRAENKRYRQLWKLADKMLEMFCRNVLEDRGAGESIKELDMRCRGDLWDVCRSGDLERLEIIIKIFGCSKDQWNLSELKRTLLHEACENRQLQVINFLLSTIEIPIQAQDASNCSALHCAARRGYFEVCQMLLDKSILLCGEESFAFILLQDNCGKTALHWSLAGSGDSIAKFQIAMLLARSCPAVLHICDQDSVYPLHLAIRRGDLQLAQEFIHLGASVCALSSVAQPSYGECPEKASWAPCGIVFQRLELQNVEKRAPVQNSDQKITKASHDKRNIPDWANIQHPVETLWYWTRQKNKLTPNVKISERKREEDEPCNSEELGCRKYGGICCHCQSFTTNDSTKPTLFTSTQLSPLLLALRMCALESDSGSMLTRRVEIMELLLSNGASPDDNLSVLAEGLRSSLRCPQLIPLLRQYGAEKISISNITLWCIAASRRDPKQVEAVLLQVLDLEIVQNSSEFLTMLFCQKYFTLICELWVRKAQKNSPEEVGIWARGGAPWKCIHETLMSWSEARKRPIEVEILDFKHLKFLCILVRSSSDIPFEKDNLHAWDLFEYCVDSILHQRRDINSNQSEVLEQTLLLCIQVLFKYWQRSEADELIRAKAANWLEPSILRGYFDCALVILETLHRLGGTSNLLDTVFESYSAALGVRTRLEENQLCHHREFLILCTEKLLQTISGSLTQKKVASVRSIVHTCATNLPLSLVVACFDMVFPTESNHSGVLSAMKTTRVGGKTTFQWVICHDRCDVMLWLLKFFPDGVERGLCWAEFVAASIGSTRTRLGEIRFSVYHEHVQSHFTSDEREELLINLVLKWAIPTDSIDLFTNLLKLLASDCGKQNSLVFLRSIVRWSAVRIAEFCLSEQFSDQINWQTLLQDIQGCSPLELCRLLGHNYLYKLLSSRVQPSPPDSKTEEKTEALETDSIESTDNSTEESVMYGILRTVIELNGKTEKLPQETFQGYQRYTVIPDAWVSAVAQNQVSHLQALSLSRTPDPDVSTRILVLAAVKTASSDALKWIVNSSAPITKHLSDEEAIECLYAAAKHPGAMYAVMTLLLLENQLNPGRLSGDGMGIPLLHRAACFSNSPLACRIMTILLERSDCDVNVLDAFGNTALSYAIASGCIHNACFLIQNAKCRLEAEYEGQSSFYYVLHLAPSFAWRLILRELLVTRDRAFLHCDAEDRTCGCKGYEGGGALCGFCEHGYSSHHIVPLPSWFRDQYDTYINSPKKRPCSRSDEGGDSENEASQHNLTDEDLSGDEDEEIVLENTRGRLNVKFLRRITVLRYGDILHANGLTTVAIEQELVAEDTASDDHCSLLQNPTEMPDCMTMEEVSTVTISTGDQRVDFNVLDANRKDVNRRRFTGAWWLRQELGMVHSPRCLCQASAFVVHPSQLAHVTVCRWLLRMAIHLQYTSDTIDTSDMVTESSIVALASVQPAFEHWRVVAKQSPIEAVPRPLPRPLSSLLFHWRYGQVFVAFQRWKNHRTSTEVTHHRLSSRLELVDAEMRRNRLRTLQIRQQQLETSIRDLL